MNIDKEAFMGARISIGVVSLLFFTLMITGSSVAGEPTENVRYTTDKILSIITDDE